MPPNRDSPLRSTLVGATRCRVNDPARRTSWPWVLSAALPILLTVTAAGARPAAVTQPDAVSPAGAPGDPEQETRPVYEDEPVPEQSPIADERAKRATPDYDGRGPEPSGASEVVLWVPRILLSPLYVVSEFVVRQPIGYVITQAEKHELPTLIVDALTFGPRRQAGIIPTALVDFGFRPSIGALFFAEDAFLKKNDLRIRAAWGGHDWRSVGLWDF